MRPVVCTVAVALVGAASGPAAKAQARPCPKGPSVIQQSPSAILYERDNVIGCHRSTGKRTYLSDIDGEIHAYPPYRIAGRFVSSQREICVRSTGDCGADLTVWDLASPPSNGFEAYAAIDGYASDVELKSNGTFAAIVQSQGSRLWRVFLHSRSTQRAKLVDAGTDIAPDSLNRSGKMVQWLRNGRLKSARLR